MIDLKKSEEAFKRAIESPEGKKYIEDFKRKHKIADGRAKKLHSFIQLADPRKLSKIEQRFFQWEKEYQDRMYTDKHVETHSAIFGTLVDVFHKYGKEANGIVDESFLKKIAHIENSGLSKEDKIKAAIAYLRGRDSRRRADMFLSSNLVYGRYRMKTYSGQGCFYRIYKGKKQIW